MEDEARAEEVPGGGPYLGKCQQCAPAEARVRRKPFITCRVAPQDRVGADPEAPCYVADRFVLTCGIVRRRAHVAPVARLLLLVLHQHLLLPPTPAHAPVDHLGRDPTALAVHGLDEVADRKWPGRHFGSARAALSAHARCRERHTWPIDRRASRGKRAKSQPACRPFRRHVAMFGVKSSDGRTGDGLDGRPAIRRRGWQRRALVLVGGRGGVGV